MFTGLVECMGTIRTLRRQENSFIITIHPDQTDFTVKPGGSVAVDGACLTLERRSNQMMEFAAVMETLNRTTLAQAQVGRRVNLERALLLTNRLDGHMVAGHIDGIGTIIKDRDAGGSLLRTISIPETLSQFMTEKGSITIDGISLTIAQSAKKTVTISIIPHTLHATTLATKKVGDSVNIECDLVARYLYRFWENAHGEQAVEKRAETLISKMGRLGF